MVTCDYLDPIGRAAVISPCETYRYMLAREFRANPRRMLLWVMLNPSTADAYEDDPTIRRCIGYARSWDYDRITVVNLFSYRATDPADLKRAAKNRVDIVGPHCDSWIKQLATEADLIVAAWGRRGNEYSPRVALVKSMLKRRAVVHALGFTRDGVNPLHPLMLPADPQLTAWRY